MRVYSSTLQEFQRRLLTNDLFEDLAANYPNVVGCSVSASEANSWRTSLPRLEAILRLAALPPDSWITIEEGIPYFAKRIDVALFGHDGNSSSNVVIVELKAWTDAVALDDENVQTQIGATLVSVPHPSLQVRGYHDHLLDFRRAFQLDAPILLSSCAYCHNYIGHRPDDGLFHYKFDEIQSISPTFGSRDAMQLAEFLRSRLSSGNGRSVVDRYDKDGIGPSKQLTEYAHEMIIGKMYSDCLTSKSLLTTLLCMHYGLLRGGLARGKSFSYVVEPGQESL